ncbi:hypothetical protein [Streptomyces misionensis]|uniref:hypothetical protein n=1 Tax=Streptomyces misionensis TaxID=67331 RepID=UPI0036A11F4A
MVSDSKAHGTEVADHLGSSEARQFLSRLSGAFGGGVLMVQKSDPGPEGADLAPSWKATPADDSTSVDAECMSHTGRSGRAGFRRIRTSFAMVVRAE